MRQRMSDGTRIGEGEGEREAWILGCPSSSNSCSMEFPHKKKMEEKRIMRWQRWRDAAILDANQAKDQNVCNRFKLCGI
jgi:hypothetical protein